MLRRYLLIPAAALFLASCDGDGATGPATPPTLTLSAQTLSLQIGQEQTFTTSYHDPAGAPTPTITWRSSNTGVATVTASGTVRGVAPGETKVIASARGVADTAVVTVLPPAPAQCGANALTIGLGEVRSLAPAEAAALCLSGGAGSEFALIVADTGSSSAAVQVSATGTIRTAGLPNPNRISGFSALGSRGGNLAPRFDFGFEVRLRERGRRLMNSRISAARASLARRALVPTPRFDLQVGDSLTLSVDTATDCTSPTEMHAARVVAVGTHSIILEDRANPSGGLGVTQYQNIAATFDNQIWPSNTENFGEPQDIDQNGKVILFYTRAVNALTPEDSADKGFVGGYFFAGDVFPASQCPTSNAAEIFYLLAPDPNGEINNNEFTVDQVIRQTEATVAHEFEHLINAERRIYVNNAPVGEESWLDEGLAHIAEELLFYRMSGLQPRGNIDLATLRSSTQILDAVNTFQVSNLARLISYLEDTGSHGPFEDDDDLETRGSIWGFLRYAVDRKSGNDRAYWFALVNSTTSGKDNLRTALGIEPGQWLVDFTTAQYADDAVGGVNGRYTFPSWNFRDVLPALRTDDQFPLRISQLPDGTTLPLNLTNDGGAAYLRAGVAAGGTGSIRLTTSTGGLLPESVRVMLIRTK